MIARVIRRPLALALVFAACPMTLPSEAEAVRCWQDPVAYHTNGMRLASTTSLRNHNVYWMPDPGHLGYCDGVMYGPCKNELRRTFRRPSNYPLRPVPAAGQASTMTHHAIDGLETDTGVRLGALPAEARGARRLGTLTSE